MVLAQCMTALLGGSDAAATAGPQRLLQLPRLAARLCKHRQRRSAMGLSLWTAVSLRAPTWEPAHLLKVHSTTVARVQGFRALEPAGLPMARRASVAMV